MIGKKMLSVGVLAVAFVALSGLASASNANYSQAIGTEGHYFVTGTSASLQQTTGVAFIKSMTPVGALLDVLVKCRDDSPVDCTGVVVGV